MSDLISRSALINALKIDRACIYSHVFSHVDCDAEEELMIDLVQIINNQPTIEAAPVVHGEWIEVGVTCGITILKCSNCGKEHPRLHENFCRDCGAKMEGGAE
jgi:hypothetical protein